MVIHPPLCRCHPRTCAARHHGRKITRTPAAPTQSSAFRRTQKRWLPHRSVALTLILAITARLVIVLPLIVLETRLVLVV